MRSSGNVSQAVAHSRAVRAAVVRRRKRMTAVALGLAATAALPVAWIMAEPAAAVVASAADEARNLAEMWNDRSPGTRTQAELTKHARAAAKEPRQPGNVIPSEPSTIPGGPSTTDVVDLLLPPAIPVELTANGAPPPFAPPTTLASIFAPGAGSASFTPPGGGGVSGGGGGGVVHLPTTEPREQLPVPSAVPEPATWAMMLMGFGLIGWRIRRRRASPAASIA